MSDLDDYVKRTVDAAPPLTTEQRAHLRGLLVPRSLEDMPPPDEVVARRLVNLLSASKRAEISEPLEVEITDE